jgi:hypothetical protein
VSRDEAADQRLLEILSKVPLEGVATPDCPSPETIWDAASGTLSPERVESLGEHAAGCCACAVIWREAIVLTRAVASSPVVTLPSRGSPSGRMTIHWPVITALAATILLGVVAICLSRVDAPLTGAGAVHREPEARSIRSLLAESMPLARDDFRLRWTEGAAGARYRVQVTTADLDLLSEGRDLERAEFLVPVAALEGVAAGDTLLWQVEAVAPDGSRVTSPTFLARIR